MSYRKSGELLYLRDEMREIDDMVMDIEPGDVDKAILCELYDDIFIECLKQIFGPNLILMGHDPRELH